MSSREYYDKRMTDTIGERQPGYQTVDQRASADLPVPLKNQKSFRASVASFAASLGILWGTVTGHDPIGKTQEGIGDAKNTAVDLGQGIKNDFDGMNNSIKYGSPIKPTQAPKSTPTAAPEVSK